MQIAVMNVLKKIWQFYYDGFRSMTVGKSLWLIILIKLFIIFVILRIFFFQPVLKGSDEDKAESVRHSLIQSSMYDKDSGADVEESAYTMEQGNEQ